MALDQALFKEDRMRRLMKDIKDIEDHTNNLRTSMNGFSNQLDSQLISQISSEISQAQSLINTLTSKVEHMSEFLQFAIKKITETEQVNTNDAKALKQASTKENIWGSLAQSVAGTVKKMADAIGHIASTITHTNPLSLFLAPIPTVLVAVAKELKLQIEGTDKEIWLGALTNDNQVNFLLGKIAAGTPGEQKWAKDQLELILQAFNEIGRCQVAYGMYAKYNNQTYIEGAHRQAVIERERLLKLGVAASYFNDDVDLTALYQNAALLACNYNPLKTDYSEMPTDNQMRFLILTAVKKDKDGEWALGQLGQIEALLQEIGTAQKAYNKLKAIGQLDKLDGEHQKAENARTKLKEMYRLAPESVDDIDFERYGIDPIIGGKEVRDLGYDMSGTQNSDPGPRYNHAKDLLNQINQINQSKFGNELLKFAEIYEANKGLYERISTKTGVPPQLIAAIHYRESGCNFETYLHNGERLGKTTSKVPIGIYFENFEEAAIDAILEKNDLKGFYNLSGQSNDMVALLAYAEGYNGFGYANNGRVSPYVYSGTNVYKSGKYIKDGDYDPYRIDGQPGIYILLKALESTISKATPTKVNNSANKMTQQQNGNTFENNVISAHDALKQDALFKEATTIPNIQNFPLYSQTDPRYADLKIGSDTMKQSGCTTTGLAAVNAWKTYGDWPDGEEPHPGRYIHTVTYDAKGNIVWGTTEISYPPYVSNKFGDSQFTSNVKESINQGHPVLFAVNGSSHWMVAIGYTKEGEVIVYDTADGSVGTCEQINNQRIANGKNQYKTVTRYQEFNS